MRASVRYNSNDDTACQASREARDCMTFLLLNDECLSPDLVELAVAAGHVESTCES